MADAQSNVLTVIASEVFTRMGREVLAAGGSDSDLMAVLESVVLGGLLFAERAYKVERRVTAERLEAMTERVCGRLAGEARHG